MTLGIHHVHVHEAMHHGILTCPSDASLGEVARIMAEYRVHMIAVTDDGHAHAAGVVSALDIAVAIASGEEPSAGQVAGTERLAVSAEERLGRAAQLMAEHSVSHLVVLDATDGHPVGVLSALDLASVYAEAQVR